MKKQYIIRNLVNNLYHYNFKWYKEATEAFLYSSIEEVEKEIEILNLKKQTGIYEIVSVYSVCNQ